MTINVVVESGIVAIIRHRKRSRSRRGQRSVDSTRVTTHGGGGVMTIKVVVESGIVAIISHRKRSRSRRGQRSVDSTRVTTHGGGCADDVH